jgi:DNA polymerase family A
VTAGGVGRGDLVALVAPTDQGLVLVAGSTVRTGLTAHDVRRIEAADGPRWVWWSAAATSVVLTAVPVARAFDLAAVHRLLHGGWRAEPGVVWARANGLDPDTIAPVRPPDLFDPGPSPLELAEPIGPDGHLRPEWSGGGWAASTERAARWGALTLDVATTQRSQLDVLAAAHPQALATARSESAAEVLCVELARDGLPLDRAEAERIIGTIVGPRPRTVEESTAQREARDAAVLRHAPAGTRADLRNPAQVRSLLRRVGVEVPDTRAWRLEQVRDVHPLVDALLAWRRIERTATTYGYGWLDEHVGADGRLHGQWTGSDGAAGRMTATAGLHSMPADLRPAIAAEPGHVLVRADLGQIEPRVLAAVSGDTALARATATDDLYAPIAAELGVDRATAKVAVLGAMYGQTTGHGAQALRRMEAAYPVAMGYLHDADVAGQVGRDVRTYGGRLIRTGTPNVSEVSDRDARSRAAAVGRYARNAMVQGAAAELFKRWAVTVRARLGAGGQIVLCLHDELLVQVPAPDGAAVAQLVDDALQEAARGWAPDGAVRFIADTAVLSRWSDAKP